MSGLPPVVRLITASVEVCISGRNCANTSGSPVGEPSAGLRAGRCRMGGPAAAGAIAGAAISTGVNGSAADNVGVWIAPVTAHVMITLLVGFAMVALVWVKGPARARLAGNQGLACATPLAAQGSSVENLHLSSFRACPR